MAENIKEQSIIMNSIIEADTAEVKKTLENIQKVSKDFQAQKEKLEKSKAKYDKKS